MDVRFVIVEPESKRKSFRVRLPIVVGRSEEAKFRIQQDRVSRKDCEFFADKGSVFIRDLGSTNGTLLGGELLETHVKTAVAPGAVVDVGSLKFRVEYDAPIGGAAASDPPAQVNVSDVTVGIAQAADSERLQVEHDERLEPSAVVEAAEATADAEEPAQEQFFATDASGSAEPTAPEPDVAKPAAGAAGADFGWLPDTAEASSETPDDDKLGEFFKGLK